MKMPALMTCGRTLIPARFMAMTYGLRGTRADSNMGQKRQLRNPPLGGVTGFAQQVLIVIRDKHTGDQDTENL